MKKFDFKDINLVPKKCIVSSRDECDTSIVFGDNKFLLPIIPANMECVIDENLCQELSENSYFYILHRFSGNEVAFVKRMKSLGLISSISVGVNQESYDLIKEICDLNLTPDYITIDIAHGHSIKMEKMVSFIKETIDTFIIAGNVSTPEGVIDLESWGSDSVKIGIGPGSACTTYPSTGFGSRNCQASVILECSNVAKKPIIADGGIKEPGDISKSLALGASMVMIGGMLSGFINSPGNLVESSGIKYKEFWGSASSFQSNKKDRIEGIRNLIMLKDRKLLDEYKYLKECLQSSISYGGGDNLECFSNIDFI
jgi:GMP reductase